MAGHNDVREPLPKSETLTPRNDVAEQLREALEFILHEAEHPQRGPAWTSRRRIAERARSALAILENSV
jgi:hypothetical protein